MKGLTEKQQKVLDYIDRFMRSEGMAPTVYEMADEFGIKPATAFAHVRALQRKGYLTRSSKARSISLTQSEKPRHMSLTLSIPLLGRISAGLPLMATENVEKYLKLDPSMLPAGTGGHQLFGLKVIGESMRDAGIMDGDMVVAKQTTEVSPGNIVVAIVEDETTVKHFYINDRQVELHPANQDFDVQTYDLERVQIQGVVIALFRTYCA